MAVFVAVLGAGAADPLGLLPSDSGDRLGIAAALAAVVSTAVATALNAWAQDHHDAAPEPAAGDGPAPGPGGSLPPRKAVPALVLSLFYLCRLFHRV